MLLIACIFIFSLSINCSLTFYKSGKEIKHYENMEIDLRDSWIVQITELENSIQAIIVMSSDQDQFYLNMKAGKSKISHIAPGKYEMELLQVSALYETKRQHILNVSILNAKHISKSSDEFRKKPDIAYQYRTQKRPSPNRALPILLSSVILTKIAVIFDAKCFLCATGIFSIYPIVNQFSRNVTHPIIAALLIIIVIYMTSFQSVNKAKIE